MTFTLVLVAAALCVVVGASRLHAVYPKAESDNESIAATNITERQLIIDATFSGVKREGERLISTYARPGDKEDGKADGKEDDGKRACPT